MPNPSVSEAILRQIDHVYVPLEDAKRAFEFLTDVLNLPEAWPYH
jgi:hypothetical protein